VARRGGDGGEKTLNPGGEVGACGDRVEVTETWGVQGRQGGGESGGNPKKAVPNMGTPVRRGGGGGGGGQSANCGTGVARMVGSG